MKKLLSICAAVGVLALTGCATYPDGSVHSAGCGTGTNYGGAALGAIGGAAVGSLIGAGTGNVLATVGGAAAGGYAGSKTRIGC